MKLATLPKALRGSFTPHWFLAVVVGCFFIPSAQAGLISPLEASFLSQATGTDADFYLLTQFYGYQGNQTLDYHSTIDLNANTWSGTLTGTYSGIAVSATYSGDFSAHPGGSITWTSTGTYGSNTWTGSGSALFVDDSSTAFHINFQENLTVGINTGSFDSNVISGTKDATTGNIDFIDTTGGGMTVNGKPPRHPKHTHHTEDVQGGYIVISDVEEDGEERITDKHFVPDEEGIPGRSGYGSRMDGSASTVPEPSTLTLFGIGIAGMAGYGLRRWKLAAAGPAAA